MVVHLSKATGYSGIIGDVCNIVPWMPVQRLLQAPLIQVMADEAHAACQHEETIQASILNKLIDLCILEGATGPKHVNEAGSNTAIHIQNEVGLFGRGDIL